MGKLERMKKESLSEYLRRRLSEVVGDHNRISRETGVSQSTVSRIHLGQASPRLGTIEPLLAWFEAQDKAKARRRSATRVRGAKHVIRGRGRSASAAIA